MHVQIIGNSHVAALRSGWKEHSDQFSEHEIEFFGVPSGHVHGMTISDDGAFAPSDLKPDEIDLITQINGSDRLTLNPDAAVVWCGQRSGLGPLLSLFNSADTDFDTPFGRGTLVSEEFLDASFEESVKASLPPQFLQKCPNGKTFHVWVPIASEDIVQSWSKQVVPWIESGSLYRLIDRYFTTAESILVENGLQQIEQAPKTRARVSGLTKAEFARGSDWLQKKNDHKQDYFHMNSAFGVLQLTHILERIAAASTTR